jgi:hypothetical protein
MNMASYAECCTTPFVVAAVASAAAAALDAKLCLLGV